MTIRKSAFLFLFNLFILSLSAQQPIIKTYAVQDGLVTNQVRRIFQDSKGFIWIGTLEGISQYNGYQFVNYTTSDGLSNSVVNDFFEIDGKVLVALNDGTICSIQHGNINTVAKTSSAQSIFTSFLKLPDGRLICCTTDDGIYEYRDGVFFKPKQNQPGLSTDNVVSFNDTLFLAAGISKLTLIKNNYNAFADTTLPLEIYNAYKDSHQRVWLCTHKGLLLVTLDDQNKIVVTNSIPKKFEHPLVKNSTVTAFLETLENEYWIATPKGLIHLSADDRSNVYTDKEGLPYTYVSAIFSDKEQNLWAGTIEGLCRIMTQNNIHTLQKAADRVTTYLGAILPWKKDEALLSTSKAILSYHYSTNSFTDFAFPEKNFPIYFFPGTKPLLFTTMRKLGYLDTIQNKITFLKSDSFLCTDPHPCVDDRGNAFLGLWGGLAIISGKKVWIHRIQDPVTAMTLDKKGFLWFGTWNLGLYRAAYSFTKDSVILSIKDFSYLLPDKQIRSLFTDSQGNIWVGSRYKGAFRLSPRENDEFDLTMFDQKHGLTSDFIKSFAETSNGDIWIGSLAGLDKLIKGKNGFRVFNFSRVNNLYGIFYSITDIGNDEWLCNVANKLVRFTDQKLENTPPLKAEINAASFGTTKDSIYIRGRTDTIITLRYFQNQAKFEFSAASFINEKQIFYSYRLSGTSDTSWSKPQNVHTVSYASLQPGHYVFEVRTIGWIGQPGKATKFSFYIQSPFWQTWWFKTVCVLLLAALLYALYRYRISQIMKLQKVRNRIATDLHDDIGSTLTNISILSELSNKALDDKQQARTYLQRISEEVNASGQALDDIIWNVNSKNDTMDEMLVRMRRFAAELFDHTNTRCQLRLHTAATGKKINMELRKDLYLVYKESLNNIYKHADAQNVKVELSTVDHSVKMLISDDGIGFDHEGPTHRNGVKNLKARVEKWKGTIGISSRPGEGTEIEIILPFSD